MVGAQKNSDQHWRNEISEQPKIGQQRGPGAILVEIRLPPSSLVLVGLLPQATDLRANFAVEILLNHRLDLGIYGLATYAIFLGDRVDRPSVLVDPEEGALLYSGQILRYLLHGSSVATHSRGIVRIANWWFRNGRRKVWDSAAVTRGDIYGYQIPIEVSPITVVCGFEIWLIWAISVVWVHKTLSISLTGNGLCDIK